MSGNRGLTLIELVAAMAVFALVSVMGLQALTGSLRMRDALAERADQSAELGRIVALLRQDMSAILPLGFYPPGGGRPVSALVETGAGFGLSRGGLSADTGPPRIGRVDWRLVDGTLIRQVWPSTTPATPGQVSPEMVAGEGILSLSLRSHWPPGVWTEGLRPPRGGATSGQAQSDDDTGSSVLEVYSTTLPEAVELTLLTRDFGRIVLVESLK